MSKIKRTVVPSMLWLTGYLKSRRSRQAEGATSLNYGLISRKTLRLTRQGKIRVENHINGTKTSIEDTNIPQAIGKGAFYLVEN